MSTAGVLATWLLLVALLALEVLLATGPGPSWAPFAIGPLMAVLVALFFMHGIQIRGAAAIFAAAGLFWLCILMGMGSLDPMTRHDIPVPVRTQPPVHGAWHDRPMRNVPPGLIDRRHVQRSSGGCREGEVQTALVPALT